MQTVKWWQNALIYHIVPRSFLDTSGDGEGDLNGIIAKLDYIAALGVDAIWLCPIYQSPREDLGYDPTDLRSIDPMYGSLEDFKRLLALAHARGLKVIIDQIWSHTSDRHPWFLEKVLAHFQEGGNCWCVGNHDYGRLRSCWTGKDASGKPYPEAFYRMMVGLLLSLPGAFCLYQGDELGLPVARIPEDIPIEEIKDPFGKALYPILPGRDGSRTPMPWIADAPNAGFTNASKPWLPIPQSHRERAVNLHDNDPNSLLNTWRRFMHWRKQQPALMTGDCQILKTEEPIFGLIRETEEQRLICLFNLSEKSAKYDLFAYPECEAIRGIDMTAERRGDLLEIPGYGVFFGNLPPAKENYPPFSPPLVQGRRSEGEPDPVR